MNDQTRKKARLSAKDRRALLEDAARICMARGGIRDFTVDKIVAEAGVSRGLITHHFGSMDGLLVAVYSRMYGEWIAGISAPCPGLTPLEALVEALVSPALFSRDVLNVWLTLWGEIANNPVLRAEHRARYGEYRDTIAAALRDAAPPGADIDADTVASAFICLVDGLGVQRCIDPDLLPEAAARTACWALLSPYLAQGNGPFTTQARQAGQDSAPARTGASRAEQG
ncbi:TetR/AcrR family transcriptional regulator [Paragemmobacter straminiformis]|uniref:TetR family transcriptional regulator n=1 Tax=Paragemmobacter straminiformis TaxID=2045119 RepID=A0A842IBG6_9RHOB|nr:TetR/AcrR family transcriptional regulator [Gemmobacter straminiformis]MBC2836697.1 TetR family transcriptional regulator [Gemmobacter straminiformis]